MSVSWTSEQQQVIDLRNRNILVSAAAGSGKTAVLVERIIKIITDKAHPVDIDRLLIVTFTNAAAAEMRERIGDAIENALQQNPGEEHLLRQLTLIHNAQITTIDSFCLYVIRNHFHEIDLEPNFRIGDEGELKLLREDVLAKVLNRNYKESTPEFLALVDGYATGRNDAALSGMILQLYGFSQSYPWPKEWLLDCVKDYQITRAEDLDTVVWMQPLIENIRFVVQDLCAQLEQALCITQESDGPDMYEKTMRSDLEKYQEIAKCHGFLEFKEAFSNLTFDRLASARGYTGNVEKQEQVKKIRDAAKDTVKKMNRQYFFAAPQLMVEQIIKTAPMAKELIRLAVEFSDAFAAEKRRKNLVDFSDLEHFALQILVDEETKEIRKTAQEFQDTFEEIMIDEYQDSNQVQETILRAISKEKQGKNNIFMVGDVKQSIYRFRLARPELFMEKYDTYSLEESVTQRIDLHKNFRSRSEVLDCTNDIFYRIMTRNLGNVEYDKDAALYTGAAYTKIDGDAAMFAPEILLVDSEDELLLDSGFEDKKQLEARMIAARIKSMLQNQRITDKKTGELRKIKYSDIVILLRSLSGYADSFAAVLKDLGIPAYTISATGYFSAVEVQTVLSTLRILDNPRQDIPLTAVLRSPIVNLTDEELAVLRLRNPKEHFYVCVLEECQKASEETTDLLETKLYHFYRMYEKMRKLVPDTPIHELIELLLKETGYGDYAAAMPAGKRRRANLEMLIEKAIAYENTSYKGLFHFVRYIDELQKYDVDFGEADMISENEDVVRIMSIHKSKGLEFPVVFVSGLGKNFNRQDVRSKMVLHPELGMGLDYMDGEKRIKAATIVKKAIAKQIDLENLGEELRVLYVALTRAKEKLIMTGTLKNATDTLEELRMSECSSTNEQQPLSYLIREGASGYLGWILPAVCSYGDKYKIKVVEAAALVTEEMESQLEGSLNEQDCMEQISRADETWLAELKNRFSQTYAHKTDITRKNKYSVSELKHRAMREKLAEEEEEITPLFLQEEIVPYVPAFASETREQENEINQGALRGTAVHRVMECYDFSSEKSAAEQMDEMLMNQKITEDMKSLVKVPLVEAFVASEVGQRMKAAEICGKLYREKPFVMGFTEEELQQFGFGDGTQTGMTDENADLTLIQGIIDVFWMEEDGIVILDYKTDRVEREKELIDRYESQLRLYAEALERVYNTEAKRTLKVKEKLLYSFRLGTVISI